MNCARLTLFIFLFLPSGLLQAEGPDFPVGHEPKICTGVLPKHWPSDTHYAGLCPPGHAVFGGHTQAANYFPPSKIELHVNCCPLPADDILLEEHIWVPNACPPGYVVTSGTPLLRCPYDFCPRLRPQEESRARRRLCQDCVKSFRCTKINSERYRLSEPQPGARYGASSIQWKELRNILRADIPPALRLGIGRFGQKDGWYWKPSSCVGWPPGSILVEKRTKRCGGLLYRRLEFRGLPGDPPAGSPVQIVPSCESIDSPVSQAPKCVRHSSSEENDW